MNFISSLINFLWIVAVSGNVFKRSPEEFNPIKFVEGRNRRPCNIQECQPRYILDRINCVCNPDPKLPSCPACPTPKFSQDPRTCECYCELECQDEFATVGVFIPEKCECYQKPCTPPITCPKGFEVDHDKCWNICKNCSCKEIVPSSESSKFELSSSSDSSSSFESSVDTSPSPSSCEPCPTPNFAQNSESCECLCDIKCKEIRDTIVEINYQRCECEYQYCDVFCEEGYIIDWEHCTSMCHGDCNCIPDPSSIPSSAPSSEQCDQQDSVCSENFVFDPILCECVPHFEPSCPDGSVYDEELCQCVCAEHEQECPEYFHWSNTTCQCVCPIGQMCPDGMIFDSELCQCICVHVFECNEGFQFDYSTCSCSCVQREVCTIGSIFDHDLCRCIEDHQPSCPHGFVYDSTACDCVCESVAECHNLQVFDTNVCQCVCPKFTRCGRGERLNEEFCYCERKMTRENDD